MDEIISLVANLGFPVALSVILLRYVLQTVGVKLEQFDVSLNKLIKVIWDLDCKVRHMNESRQEESKK